EKDNPPPSLVVQIEPEHRQRFIDGYQSDPALRRHWEVAATPRDPWHPSQRYFKDELDLLYFRDADFVPRLCVPKSEKARILREAHESPSTTAHAG
ncbi:hypothetical protein PENSPDRAFT_546443, partial [Peniophora sp. CONT]